MQVKRRRELAVEVAIEYEATHLHLDVLISFESHVSERSEKLAPFVLLVAMWVQLIFVIKALFNLSVSLFLNHQGIL